MGALCIVTAINSSELPKAALYEHTVASNPVKEARDCARRNPEAVGLSIYIWNSDWFSEFASELKKIHPAITIFAGGPQVAAFKGKLPQWADFAVHGEGEITTVKKISELFSNGKVERKIFDAELPDTNTLESVFLSHNADRVLKNTNSILWEMTRGCPYKCAFCFESRGNRTVRDFPMERIARELDFLVGHNVKNIFVLDPTFNLNRKRAKEILTLLLEKSPAEMHYVFEIRAELVDKEMAQLFAQLNCSLQIGLQSSNMEVLKNIDREWDRELFTKNVKYMAKLGIPFGLDVIAGLPRDTFASFKNTIDYAVGLQPSNIDCFVLSILPGTKLEVTASDFGLEYGTADKTVSCTPTFNTAEMVKAKELTASMNFFYTKGQSCIWIHALLDAIKKTPSQLFELFATWMHNTGHAETEDVWDLQDEFGTWLFKENGFDAQLDAMLSYMTLHQGFSYVMETGECVNPELSYRPNDLAMLDTMSIMDFVKKYRKKKCTPLLTLGDDGVQIY